MTLLPARLWRALRGRALSPAGVGALPCTGKRSSLYRGLTSPAGEKRIPRAVEYTPEGGVETGSLTVTTDGGSDSHAVTLVSH